MDENPYKAPAQTSDQEIRYTEKDEAELRISPLIALGGVIALAMLTAALMFTVPARKSNPSHQRPRAEPAAAAPN
jgi:hypothetical protein